MVREIWFHALGAKAGGGLTYLRAVVPEMVRQLEGRHLRLVLIMPELQELDALPGWVEVRVLPFFAGGPLRRLVYDQIVLPVALRGRGDVAVLGTGSFVPTLGGGRKVALLRNAIYVDPVFLARERLVRVVGLRIQRWLIAAGAARCCTVFYPTRAIRELAEMHHPGLRPQGAVNPFGIDPRFLAAGPLPRRHPSGPATFLYVMNHTLQKNVIYLLRALAMAKAEGVGVRVKVTSTLDHGPRGESEGVRDLIERHDLVGSGHLVLAGSVRGEDLLAAYEQADGVVFPSICESFGHPLVEAMCLDRPLVVADRPYAREMCGDNAVFVDPYRPESLVQVWKYWPAPLKRLTPVDQQALRRRFSWERHVGRLIEALLGEGAH